MDKVRDIFSYFVAAMSIFTMLGAVYQAFNDQKGSALTLGTIFLVGALIVFLPQVEFIKTLGVEARLRQTVTEAVATLASVRRLAEISARASYLTIAWGNRLGTPSAKDKQSVLDDIDEYMPSNGGWLSDKELAAFQSFKLELVRLNDDCAKKGGYTVEAADYYDRYKERQADREKAKQLWEASR